MTSFLELSCRQRVVAMMLFVLPGVLMGCQRESRAREVPAGALERIGSECLPEGGCGQGLVCAQRTNFAHVDAGFACELVCDARSDPSCPEGWVCVKAFDGRAAGLPGHCLRASEM
ncbi:hypothetical protein COCOR_02373 [Corallococcus coralloides DSM 2259]|uniref:Uncharacterized protein n=1 Tax=Corallococcus coralloides (strain ATCC 25202 / DSM 2259 / NBRC 100086 / M2) TaxID=1144275 RepID=H8MN74_CORCM|nr:hypothetical protein COCOR_02373 [Corallococcus coralloides DSM 2259]